MQTAFANDIEAARTWLLDARLEPEAPTATPPVWRWGALQDGRASALNTAEALVALAGDARLDAEVFASACRYMIAELDVAERCTVRHAGWIALALDCFDEHSPCPAMQAEIVRALATARARVVADQNEDGGWGSQPDEDSIVPTTALVLRALAASDPAATATGVAWLLQAQNGDGGWGLVADSAGEYAPASGRLERAEARKLARSRTVSNAACTAYAMLALADVGHSGGAEGDAIGRGRAWLAKEREPRSVENPDPGSGGWLVFHERGIRGQRSYTYRHFSTAWAILALLAAGDDPRDTDLLEAIVYLRSLAQPPLFDRAAVQIEGGGWRCSSDGEPYVWATSNAIMALRAAAERIEEVKGDEVVDILLRERRAQTATFVGRAERPLVTNARTMALVSAVTTVVAAGAVVAAGLGPASKSLWFLILAAGGAVAAVPWSVYCAVRADPKAPRYGPAFAGVYTVVGLILGVVGASYFG